MTSRRCCSSRSICWGASYVSSGVPILGQPIAADDAVDSSACCPQWREVALGPARFRLAGLLRPHKNFLFGIASHTQERSSPISI
jgi:hypothetical protein